MKVIVQEDTSGDIHLTVECSVVYSQEIIKARWLVDRLKTVLKPFKGCNLNPATRNKVIAAINQELDKDIELEYIPLTVRHPIP